MDSIAVLVFTFECCVKILEQGDQPLVYFTDPDQGWLNCFDFALVAVSAFEFIASAGRGEIMHDYAVFRIVRLLRLLSLLHGIKKLKVIVTGVANGLRSAAIILMLLFLVCYISAIIGVKFFADNDPANFGSIPQALVTLFRVSNLAGWTSVAYTQTMGCNAFTEFGAADVSSSFLFPSFVPSFVLVYIFIHHGCLFRILLRSITALLFGHSAID